MTGFRWLLDQFFQLPRWERVANLAMIGIIVSTIVLINAWPEEELPQYEKQQLDTKKLVLQAKKDFEEIQRKKDQKTFNEQRLDTSIIFIHDINAVTIDQLDALGVKKYIGSNLVKYISKGGKIRSKEDLEKIYGMQPADLNLILAHTKLDTSTAQTVKTFKKRERVDLNTADSVTLSAVYGISPKMASRILKFRNSIGAFHSVEQINEAFKTPIEHFEKIKEQLTVQDFKPFISINTITFDELKKYRYFRKDNLAATLIAFRDKHGKFTRAEDLKKCAVVSDEVYAKIIPYLIFD